MGKESKNLSSGGNFFSRSSVFDPGKAGKRSVNSAILKSEVVAWKLLQNQNIGQRVFLRFLPVGSSEEISFNKAFNN
jgi:hypothetical protein